MKQVSSPSMKAELGFLTQQRQLLQVGKAAQRTGSSALSTQHFQDSGSSH